MTALHQYTRLEAEALWHPPGEDAPREVIVSIGDATLMVSDLNDNPLTHWSLAALVRSNPGDFPARYHPNGDHDETLSFAQAEQEMVTAIETLQNAITRGRPQLGWFARNRRLVVGLVLGAVLAGLLLWLPFFLPRHAARVVPQVKREEIGAALLGEITRRVGPVCDEAGGAAALGRLSQRLGTGRLMVVSEGVAVSVHLPGQMLLLNQSIFVGHDDPEIAAGQVLAEELHARARDPMLALLERGGLRESLHLLTTGSLRAQTIARHAEFILAGHESTPGQEDVQRLRDGFAAARLRTTPYALSGYVPPEVGAALKAGDPFPEGTPIPILTDTDWIRLQNICPTE